MRISGQVQRFMAGVAQSCQQCSGADAQVAICEGLQRRLQVGTKLFAAHAAEPGKSVDVSFALAAIIFVMA